ncbi:unnamed protein product [Orchesella dallaii]|uniref:Uncharacterized protein n=1 Tax=Orchesella dallaii TaxID=48710 RepID=A0ABP1RN02_9HEXA
MSSSAGAGGTVTEELFCNKCKIPLPNEEKEAHREWHKKQDGQVLGRPRGPRPKAMKGVPIRHLVRTASPRCPRPPVKKYVVSPRATGKRNKATKQKNELPSPSSRPRTRAAATATGGKAD